MINKTLAANYFKVNNTQNFQHYEIKYISPLYRQIPDIPRKRVSRRLYIIEKLTSATYLKFNRMFLIFNNIISHSLINVV